MARTNGADLFVLSESDVDEEDVRPTEAADDVDAGGTAPYANMSDFLFGKPRRTEDVDDEEEVDDDQRHFFAGNSPVAMPHPLALPPPLAPDDANALTCAEVRAELSSFFAAKDNYVARFEAAATRFSAMAVDERRQMPRVLDRHARLVNISQWSEEEDDDDDVEMDILLPAALVPSSSLHVMKELETSRTNTSTLKPHQIEGIRFLWSILVDGAASARVPAVGCILAHTMGLGKTAQVVVFLHLFMALYARNTRQRRDDDDPSLTTPTTTSSSVAFSSLQQPVRVLVVIPKSTQSGWLNEFETWSAYFPRSKRLRPQVIDESNNASQRVERFRAWRQRGGVLLIGYEALVRLLELAGKQPSPAHPTHASSSSTRAGGDGESRWWSWLQHEDASVAPMTELLVCDEAHRLKSVKLQVVSALRSLQPRRRLLLTGTPLQNHLMEYWAMIEFAMPRYFDRRRFQDYFLQPIQNSLHRKATHAEVDAAKKKTFTLIREVRHFVLRVDGTPLAKELPPLHEYIVLVALSDVQKELYTKFLALILNNTGINNFQFLPTVAYSAKIAAHPKLFFDMNPRRDATPSRKRSFAAAMEEDSSSVASPTSSTLIRDDDTIADESVVDDVVDACEGVRADDDDDNTNDDDATSPRLTLSRLYHSLIHHRLCQPPKGYSPTLHDGCKLEVAMRIITSAIHVGEKTLVFSLSTLLLDWLEQLIVAEDASIRFCRLDGSHTNQQRRQALHDFSAHDGPQVFLLSMKAGGVGLTITAASRVVLMDSSFNPADDQQAIGRAYRYGQQKDVFVYRLLAQHTMEHIILDQKIAKEWLFRSVVEESSMKRDGLAGMHITALFKRFEESLERLRAPPKPPTAAQVRSTQRVCDEDADVFAKIPSSLIIYAQPFNTFLEADEDEAYGEEEQAYYRNFQQARIFDGGSAAAAAQMPGLHQWSRTQQRRDLRVRSEHLLSMVEELVRSKAESNPGLTNVLSAMGVLIAPHNTSTGTSVEQRGNTVGGGGVDDAVLIDSEDEVMEMEVPQSSSPAPPSLVVSHTRYIRYQPGSSANNAIDIE